MKKSTNKLILTSWSYNEGLIQAAVLPYLEMIHKIDPDGKMYLVTEEKSAIQKSKPEDEQTLKLLDKLNIVWKPQPYQRFGLKKIIFAALHFISLWWLIVSKRIKYIHAFCTPAGSIGYFLAALTGAKLIIDSYEPHAESMVENATWPREGTAFKILWWLEKKQSAKAYWCIGVASGMHNYAKQKWGVQLKNFSIRPMCVNLEKFIFSLADRDTLRKQLEIENKIVAVYAGKFGGIYYDKEVFNFFESAYNYWGEKFRVLILSNQPRSEIQGFYAHTKLPDEIVIIKNVPYNDMPSWLSVADFAVTPVKPVPSKRYCSPIKDGEYWSIGLPVVIPENISDDSRIIKEEGIGCIIDFSNPEKYLQAFIQIERLLQTQDDTREKIRAVAEKFRNFDKAADVYMQIYK